ncbi:phytoene desaturase family protein [Flavitalea sp. BT771]|uniref:phytoene desaturase family protein n=1 Tax=Flavitalea sp. BT771 TaxID=3063329 RepID=UPI0026E3DAB3|nr:phytoene desaturase family protein [Flavitalea sp. BT771]MDO6432817.1 phytoene desaturase family protein [Flavitalea sp. BT771]MDV6221907.1 phytoene desaturase family protein [Flavitalea sp. BT771]
MGKIAIIGSGISGMVAACHLQKQGYRVTVFEKSNMPGGRARQFRDAGFVFDMGPSWYWMPEIFEHFFNEFGKSASDYYSLIRLDPSYRVYFKGDEIAIPASMEALGQVFEQLEPGSAKRLKIYLNHAAEKYRIGMYRYATKPSLRLSEFVSKDVLSLLKKLQPFRNMQEHVDHYFKHPMIRKIMQFPVIFLGAMPERIPAMYSLMNYADTALGTWYPEGGMFEVPRAVHRVAEELGVEFRFEQDIDGIEVLNGKAVSVSCAGHKEKADLVIGAGDYHYMEQLLDPAHRQYNNKYWNAREMAPSCLLYFLGVDKKLPLDHHNLFFDTSFDDHARSLYKDPQWPEDPLFYVCAPSVTDPSVAPAGCENLFILIPVASGLEGDCQELREIFLEKVIRRLEERMGTSVKDHIIYKRNYALKDFSADYHAFRGNAYGLANTLKQTAFGKPRMRSGKVSNLFFCGQLTVPGPGLPPAFLSGRTVAMEAAKYLKEHKFFPNPLNYDANEYRLSF